mgnify:FL=1
MRLGLLLALLLVAAACIVMVSAGSLYLSSSHGDEYVNNASYARNKKGSGTWVRAAEVLYFSFSRSPSLPFLLTHQTCSDMYTKWCHLIGGRVCQCQLQLQIGFRPV